ncbi:MAG: hypothetical protein ABIJ36_01965 [Patescibacteria group bacterium]
MLKKSIFAVTVVLGAFVALALLPKSVSAETICTPVYGGGQNCIEIKDRDFSLEKKVRFGTSGEFKSKITGAEAGDTVQFRITVKNTGSVDVDEVEIKDDLPKYLKTKDDTDWKIKNFKAGDEEEIYLKAKVVDPEDLPDNDICVVNEARLEYEGKTRASDTATVCIVTPSVLGVKELPVTGAGVPFGGKEISLAVMALGMLFLGIGLKKFV